jgi:hypothetical protein
MAFCTNCGNQVSDAARFCPNCGQTVNGSGTVMTAMSSEPLDYTIQGDNLQVVRVRLKPGQEVYAEAGKMVYKTANVQWETKMTGNSLGQKIWGALKRTLRDEFSVRRR